MGAALFLAVIVAIIIGLGLLLIYINITDPWLKGS